MIVNLPDTTTRDVNNALVEIRERGGAVALGRVLTLVIDSDREDVEPAIRAANTASREHPCRVIVVAPAAERNGDRLDAQIRVGGDAGASEVVVLRHSGALSEHQDTLVIPLLLPDAPIVAWWPNEVPSHPAEHPVGQMAQRRITDTASCAEPLAALRRLSRVHAAGDTDLAWTRLTSWRAVLATALDQPPFEPVRRVRVAGEPNHPSIDLLGAWLGLSLDCPVELDRTPGAVGITEVALHRDSGPIVLARLDGKTAVLRQPNQLERRISLPIRELPDCLTEELRRLDPDEVYGEVLTQGLPAVLEV